MPFGTRSRYSTVRFDDGSVAKELETKYLYLPETGEQAVRTGSWLVTWTWGIMSDPSACLTSWLA